MSWLTDLFRQPQLGYSPSLEPPGWGLLRDQLMRKIFSLQASPYGYDPSLGQSMNSLLPTQGRGLFNPYTGGYGGAGGGSPSPGGMGPRQMPQLAQPGQRTPQVVGRDGVECGMDSPYMFQQGPRILGSDGPSFSKAGGMAPPIRPPMPMPGWRGAPSFNPGGAGGYWNNSPYRQAQNAYFGGNPADILRQLGFSWTNGPNGTTFNRGGQSYLNQGASHEGAGFGGESNWLAGMGFTPGMGQGGLPQNRQYGGQLGMVDKMLAQIAQQNRRGLVDPNGAMGQHLASTHPAGFRSGMGGAQVAALGQPKLPTGQNGNPSSGMTTSMVPREGNNQPGAGTMTNTTIPNESPQYPGGQRQGQVVYR